jgi:hypothetical protein
LSLALTLLATSAWPAEPEGPAPVAAPTTAPAATAATAEPPAAKPADAVVEITIDPNAQTPVCRRYTPTGSRIATEVCEQPTAKISAAAEQANRDALRRDIEDMRAQQMVREQARQQAQADAMRRRMSGQ